jgi:acyl phosphate:glycerol-3-phosphate acyltransferase
MLIDAIIVIAAYLIGSLSGSLILGRLRGVDIRQLGSGNAGGTNAFRTQGFKFALGVVCIDIAKGAVVAYMATYFAPADDAIWLPHIAVLVAVIGHVWPIFHGFRGGKGAATLVGGILIVWPAALLPLIMVWLLCLSITGYVGLSTMLAGATLCLLAYWQQASISHWMLAVLAAWLMLFTHRSNIERLMQGKENRFEKAMLWQRIWQHYKR